MANTIYNINRLWSCASIPVYAKTMLPPTDVNIHSRANRRAPADRPSGRPRPLSVEGHTAPIVWVNDGLRQEKREKTCVNKQQLSRLNVTAWVSGGKQRSASLGGVHSSPHTLPGAAPLVHVMIYKSAKPLPGSCSEDKYKQTAANICLGDVWMASRLVLWGWCRVFCLVWITLSLKPINAARFARCWPLRVLRFYLFRALLRALLSAVITG